MIPYQKHWCVNYFSADGRYWCYNWRWSVDTNHTLSPLNSAPVAVIDGSNILLTCFRHSVVPPPMATHTLSLPAPVTSVTFAPPSFDNHFLALLADGRIAVFSYKERQKEGVVTKDSCGFIELVESPQLVGMAPVGVECVRCVTWWKPDKLLAVGTKEGKEVIVECVLLLGSEVKISIG